MVQEARLDLRIWAALSLGLLLLASPALAQDDPPLTTLLLPHHLSTPTPLSRTAPLSSSGQLFGDDPLANVDALSGEGSLSSPRPRRPTATAPGKLRQDRATCDQAAIARQRRATSGVASGGSGPGEYARFLNNGRQASGKPGSAPTSSTPSVPGQTASKPAAPSQASAELAGDRPLYGGIDRPLWSAPRARADHPSRAPQRQAAEPGDPLAAPNSEADGPLWAESAAADRSATPCPDGSRRAVAAPLFFGTGAAP